jgi:hypothetical protein
MKMLACALLCGIALMLPLGAGAQTVTAPPPSPAAQDKSLVVAPQAISKVADQPGATEPRAAAAAPANICRELVAFLQPKPPPQPAGASQPGPSPAGAVAGPAVQASGQPAPVPQAPTAPAPPPDALEQANILAEANDLKGCQQAAQKLRRAGIAMPAGLIALAALKVELLGAAKP